MATLLQSLTKIGILIMLVCLSTQIVSAQAPEINPLRNDKNEQIFLPGASGENKADQGQFIQGTFLPRVTTTVIGLTGGLAFLFVIIAGVQILAAFGVEDKIAKAKKTLTWAIIGLLISILSYAIVQIIVSVDIGTKKAPAAKNPQAQQQPKQP